MVPVPSLAGVTLATGVLLTTLVTLCYYYFPPRSMLVHLRAFERREGIEPVVAGMILVLSLSLVGGVFVGAADPDLVDVLAVLGGALGAVALAVALGARLATRRLDGVERVRTGLVGRETVVVDGVAAAQSRPVETPVGPALSCAWLLQRARLGRTSTAWISLAEGEETVPLTVDDDSGPVRVDAERATVRSAVGGAARRATVYLPADESPSADVETFLSYIGVDVHDVADADHRLKLRVLPPGETLTAVGTHERLTRRGETFWGLTADYDPAFLFGGPYRAVRSQLHRRIFALGFVGSVGSVFGVGYVASYFLPF